MIRRWFILVLVIACWFGISDAVWAGTIEQRLAAFPQWSVPTNLLTNGELTYPAWFAGEWQVTSILKEQIAPLAPQIVTPGFDRNKTNIDRPYQFRVRFGSETTTVAPGISISNDAASQVLADRAFNGQQIVAAYLGEKAVESIEVIKKPQIKQITRLAVGTQLTVVMTGYQKETASQRLMTTELNQQIFQGKTIYLNTVETTTSYQLLSPGQITAQQVTAIYLSPQDPDYFQALQQPVALYRYVLNLTKS
jgi:anion-transporting  ArsA/GET3 family ATPase